MGNCAKLKWNRKRMGLSQKEFAEKVGVCTQTISRLENDETAWSTIRSETEDKICSVYESMASYQPERAQVRDVIETMSEIVEEPVAETLPSFTQKILIKKSSALTTHDAKTLALMEFAYEGLIQADTHEDFAANLNMIRRIIEKY